MENSKFKRVWMPKQVSKQVSNSNPSNHHHLLCLAIRNSELKTAPRCLGLSPIRSRDPSSSSARAQSQHSKKNKCVTVCVCVCFYRFTTRIQPLHLSQMLHFASYHLVERKPWNIWNSALCITCNTLPRLAPHSTTFRMGFQSDTQYPSHFHGNVEGPHREKKMKKVIPESSSPPPFYGSTLSCKPKAWNGTNSWGQKVKA